MQIQITLNDLDAAVFARVAADPVEWATNAVAVRIAAKKSELAELEAAQLRQEGAPALDTIDDLVRAAIERAGQIPPPSQAPDNPTNSDWQVGLLLWGRREEVLGKVEAERAKGTVIGKIADVRVNYANNVLRAQLMQLKDVFGFSEAEIEESLWRADRVAKGDLSGRWPLAS